jgi:hypothetical protein
MPDAAFPKSLNFPRLLPRHPSVEPITEPPDRHSQERYLARYRALNTVLAVLGLLLLGWLFSHRAVPVALDMFDLLSPLSPFRPARA